MEYQHVCVPCGWMVISHNCTNSLAMGNAANTLVIPMYMDRLIVVLDNKCPMVTHDTHICMTV